MKLPTHLRILQSPRSMSAISSAIFLFSGRCQQESILALMKKEQVDGTKVPSYGRHGLTKGELIISQPEEIMSVDIKVG